MNTPGDSFGRPPHLPSRRNGPGRPGAAGRNIVVGLFMIVASLLIAGMTLTLRGGLRVAGLTPGYPVRITLSDLQGVSDGVEVRLNGKRIGTVVQTELDPDLLEPPRMLAMIDRRYRIPKQARAVLVTEALGRRYIELTYRRTSAGAPVEFWPQDATTPIEIAGDSRASGLEQVGETVRALQGQIAEAVDKATTLLNNLNTVVEENRRAVNESVTGIAKMLGSEQNQRNLDKALAFLGGDKLHRDIADSVEGVRKLTADPKLQEDVQTAVADVRAAAADLKELSARLREATAGADRLAAKVEKTVDNTEALTRQLQADLKAVSTKLTDDLERTARVLQSVQAVAHNLESGQGTAGKLLNDPKLYEAMIDLVRQLNLASEDLRKLVKKWDEGGLKLKL